MIVPDGERPTGSPAPAEWASDSISDALRVVGLRYISMNPGASYRGLHDSVVNHLGNEHPEFIVCLHEEHAVAIAHGYAKATGEAMGVALHSNVGLMHAVMSIYNAYCDRAPMVIVNATGPVDAMKRRHWIDWLHTSADHGALVRPFVKWDDQPMSAGASVQSIVRGAQIARSEPQGPVFVCFDSAVLESEGAVPSPDVSRYPTVTPGIPAPDSIRLIADRLTAARHPVILMGRVGRSDEQWAARVRLAESLGATVVTDIKEPACFPTDHPLHAGYPATRIGADGQDALRMADVVLGLEWLDFGGAIASFAEAGPFVANVSLESYRKTGWTKIDYWPVEADVVLPCRPDDVVEALLGAIGAEGAGVVTLGAPAAKLAVAASAKAARDDDLIELPDLASAVYAACEGSSPTLVRAGLNWPAWCWPLRGPMDYLGGDGGGGIGAGPGQAVGSALGLAGSGRLPVAVLGDGDFLMGATAVWTAAHYRIPLLIVVANNNSYLNDQVHQDRMGVARGRERANAGVATRIEDPAVDIAALARAQGAEGFGPVASMGELGGVLDKAVASVQAGGVAVVDVRIYASGSSSDRAAGAVVRG